MLNFIRLLQHITFHAAVIIALAACGGGGGGGGGDTGGGGGGGGGTDPVQYSVSVIASGLSGTGLQVTLGSGITVETLNFSSDGTQSFSAMLDSGVLYGVTLGSQPSGQLCEVTGNTGTISSDTTLSVTCADTYTIGGSVSGATGSVSLKLNNSEILTVSANGGFTFTDVLVAADTYAVTVSTQPTGQTCTVSNSGGAVGSTNVTNVSVSCSTSVVGYLVGGRITGLSGLVVLSLNGAEELSRTTNGNFTFSTPLPSTNSYIVTVLQQPTGQSCVVTNSAGIIASSDFSFVDVTCETINTAVGVYLGSGSIDNNENITLTLNGSEDRVFSGNVFNNAYFVTRLAVGAAYSVSINTLPPGKVCHLYNNNGVIEAGVTPVITAQCVFDASSEYTVGGAVSGLTGSGLKIRLDSTETLAIDAASTSYVFTSSTYATTIHSASVVAQPSGQICSLWYAEFITNANVVDLNVICSNGPHSIGGYVAGVKNSGLSLLLNDAESLVISADGSFSFSTLLSDSMRYDVKIASHPTGQTCSLTRASGYNISASVNDIVVDCADTKFSVNVNVAGYNSTTPLLLQMNDGEILSANQSTLPVGFAQPYAFSNTLKDTLSYNIRIAGQPEGQICSLTNDSGIIDGADVTNVAAYCEDIATSVGPYNVSVTTSGLLGSGLTLQLNAGSNLLIGADGDSTFSTQLADATAFTVTILNQPDSPIQDCAVNNAGGTIAAADFTQVYVVCRNGVTPKYSNNGSRWLDYVKNDGADIHSATDTACEASIDGPGYAACLNGGEHLQVSLPDLADCTGVTAADSLNAFDWVCNNSNGVKVMSTGLKNNISLSDLVDFTKGEFKPNFVTINDAVTTYVTQSNIWWDNPVKINNTGETINSSDIVLVTGDVPSVYTLASNSALLIQPGFAIKARISNSVAKASNKNYLWFEGDINDVTPMSFGGISFNTTNFSVINNVEIQYTGGNGLFMVGDNNKIHNLDSHNNDKAGVEIRGNNYDMVNVIANNNLGYYGLYLTITNSTLTTLAGNGSERGILLEGAVNLVVTNMTANNNTSFPNSYGIKVSSGSGNSFTNITANNNQGNGFHDTSNADNSYNNINTHNNGGYGFYLNSMNNSPVSDVKASGNGSDGVYLFRWDDSTLDLVYTANNTGSGVFASQSKRAVVSNSVSSNNGGYGFKLQIDDSIIVNLTAANNAGIGITPGYVGVLLSSSAIQNVIQGFSISDETTGSSLLAANNEGNGMSFGGSTFTHNVVSANNTGYGFRIIANYDHFTGMLAAGSNGGGDCSVDTVFNDFTGLLQGGSVGNPDNTCNLNESSDATIVEGIDITTSVIGKVTVDDTVNASDDSTPGTALFQNVSNWYAFENAYRTWGKDGLTFTDASNQGICNSLDEACRIWDWSAATADAGNAGAAAIYDVVAVPTGNDIFEHAWSYGASSQSDCTINIPGSVWDSASSCISTFLRNSWEIAGDAIGNDNYLCESGETCLYTPNIGSYQGHGALVSAGTIGTGATLENIILKKYEFIGR